MFRNTSEVRLGGIDSELFNGSTPPSSPFLLHHCMADFWHTAAPLYGGFLAQFVKGITVIKVLAGYAWILSAGT